MTDFEKEVLDYIRFRKAETEKTERTLIFLHIFLGIAISSFFLDLVLKVAGVW